MTDEFDRLLADAQRVKAHRDAEADRAAKALAAQLAAERARAMDLIPELNRAVARLRELEDWSRTGYSNRYPWNSGDVSATLESRVDQDEPPLPPLAPPPPKRGLFRSKISAPPTPPESAAPKVIRSWGITVSSDNPERPVQGPMVFVIPVSGAITVSIPTFEGSSLEDAAKATLVKGLWTWPPDLKGYGGGHRYVTVHVVEAFEAALKVLAMYIADRGG